MSNTVQSKTFTNPVFCAKTQMMYDKEEIEKAINSTGQCPYTGIEINQDDIIKIKQPPYILNNKNRETTCDDILSKLKMEYDLLIYEKFNLTNELNKLTFDLNDKLRKNEAAAMVIARLIQGKDSAIELLNQYKARFNKI